jgi:5-methylcytosine-specific restriction protein A
MPRTPKRPCRQPGCPALSDGPYCEQHRKLYARETAAQRGYDGRWRKARALFLRKHPLCVGCLRAKRLTPATIIDHIVPHRGDERLFWDEANWQPLCARHHNEKTGSGK